MSAIDPMLDDMTCEHGYRVCATCENREDCLPPERLQQYWRLFEACYPPYRELLEAAERCDHSGSGQPGCTTCDVRVQR